MIKISYNPHSAYRWFGIATVIGGIFLLFIMLLAKQFSQVLLALCILTFMLAFYLIRQSHKEILVTEESITIRGEAKEDLFFLWEELPYAYIRGGYRVKWIVLSWEKQTDDEINKYFRYFMMDRFVRKECIVFPIVPVIKGSAAFKEYIIEKYGLDEDHARTIQGIKYLWF